MTATIQDGSSSDLYKCFLEPPLLPDWQKSLTHPIPRIEVKGLPPTDYSKAFENKRLELKKGIARLTQFGTNFISTCVIEAEFVAE